MNNMNAKTLGKIFLASVAIGAGYEIGRIFPMVGIRVFNKKFREDVKKQYKAEYKKREAKSESRLRVVDAPIQK